MLIDIYLEGEPRGWARPRVRVVKPNSGEPFASFFIDAKTRKFEESLKWKAKAAMRSTPPIEGPVRVRVVASMGVPKSWTKAKRAAALAGTVRPTGKPDWDNFAKMLDAFNEIVWGDDAQIVEGSVSKVYSTTPSLRVVVEPLAAEAAGEDDIPLLRA